MGDLAVGRNPENSQAVGARLPADHAQVERQGSPEVAELPLNATMLASQVDLIGVAKRPNKTLLAHLVPITAMLIHHSSLPVVRGRRTPLVRPP